MNVEAPLVIEGQAPWPDQIQHRCPQLRESNHGLAEKPIWKLADQDHRRGRADGRW